MELATSLEARAENKKLFSLLLRILKLASTIFNWTEEVSSMKQKNLKSFTESEHMFNLKKFTQNSQHILIRKKESKELGTIFLTLGPGTGPTRTMGCRPQ